MFFLLSLILSRQQELPCQQSSSNVYEPSAVGRYVINNRTQLLRVKGNVIHLAEGFNGIIVRLWACGAGGGSSEPSDFFWLTLVQHIQFYEVDFMESLERFIYIYKLKSTNLTNLTTGCWMEVILKKKQLNLNILMYHIFNKNIVMCNITLCHILTSVELK